MYNTPIEPLPSRAKTNRSRNRANICGTAGSALTVRSTIAEQTVCILRDSKFVSLVLRVQSITETWKCHEEAGTCYKRRTVTAADDAARRFM